MSKKVGFLLLGACLISFIAQMALYPSLPETIPIHWNAAGEIDGWGSKTTLFALNLLPVGILALLALIPKIDPKKENFIKHKNVYQPFSALMVFFMIGVNWMCILAAMGIELPVSTILMLAMGVIFILLGNYMPRIRPNYTFGIRTPWTLASETVWKKTHRVGGYVFVVSGIIIAVCSFFPGWASLIGIGVLLAGAVASSVYSWVIFREEQNHNH